MSIAQTIQGEFAATDRLNQLAVVGSEGGERADASTLPVLEKKSGPELSGGFGPALDLVTLQR
jgi:hypothetical protein